MTLPIFEDSDWRYVFSFASGKYEGCNSDPSCPEWVAGDEHSGVASPATVDDVVEVIAQAVEHTPDDGSYCDSDFWMVARLQDGRFLFVTAGCDTTGWGCRDGGRSYCASSLERLVIAMTPEERIKLGLSASGAANAGAA